MYDLTSYQTIKHDEEVLYYIVPREELVQLIHQAHNSISDIPHEVARRLREGKSLLRAWREYKKVSQQELAQALNISQSAISKMEQPGVKHHHATSKKLAQALDIRVAQLTEAP